MSQKRPESSSLVLLFRAALCLIVGCAPPTGAPKDTNEPSKPDSGGQDSGEPFDPGPSPYTMDDVLRLSDVQARGTHNSYHVQPETPIVPSHAYTHLPLSEQLASQGVRQFELDLHYHQDLGFQVFHLPAGVDQETTCLQFVDCLGEVLAWSDRNPWHMPIMIWLEPKDEDLDWATEEYLPFLDKHGELESVITSVIPRSRILTPDELRGGAPDLPSAVVDQGWPHLGSLRGRFVFAMLDSSEHRAAYLAESSILAGRLMFVDADSEADPFAAMFKIDDALGERDRVSTLVAAGFVVTSNVDSVDEADADNQAQLEATLAAGAHFFSSDIPAPEDGRAYWADLPDGSPARCNPVHAPSECTSGEIEALP